MKKLPWTIFLLHLITLATAQKANFEFYNAADGLSGNFTANVVQDDKGFLWVINDYKLHRFDGRKFVRYPLADNRLSISDKRLSNISIYQDSLLMISSENEVFVMNPMTDDWQSYPYPDEVVKRGDFVFTTDTGEDQLFLSFSENLAAFDIWSFSNGTFTKKNRIPIPHSIYALNDFTKADNFYSGLGDKLYKTEIGSGETKEILQLTDCSNCSILHVFLQGADKYILVVSEQTYQVYLFDADTETVQLHPVSRFFKNNSQLKLNALRPGDKGNFWICGNDRNLVYYDAVQDTLYDFQSQLRQLIPDVNDIIYLIPDNTGTVWGVTRLGLLKITLQSSAFDRYFDEPQAACGGYCSFRGFTEDSQGRIYAGFYRGIAKFDPKTKQELSTFTSEAYPFPWGLHYSGEAVWLNNGQLLDTESGRMTAIPGSNAYIAEAGLFSADRSGKLWWVYNESLFYLDTVDNQVRWEKELELPNKGQYLTEAIQAGQYSGQLWISHRGRLLRYSPESNDQKWFDATDWQLPVSRILAIEEVRDGGLWLATDIGLVYFNPATGQSLRYTTKDGLANDFVCGMLTEGDSCLWLSTNSGLSRFHIASASFINFFEEDGLTHNEFNRFSYFKASNGRMFFGGLRGINAFFPQELMSEYRRRNEAAQIVLSSFEFTDERQDTTFVRYGFAKLPEMKLNYWHRSFTFEYALTDYRKPEEVYYSYKMDGYEDTWSTPSQFNFTRFSSLPAGKYTFRVKARDSHGLWHPNQLAVLVTVYPPWWKTGWAYLVYFLLFLGIGYVVYYFLKRRLLLRNELHLQAEEARRLKELDAFKSKLYTNLTHEFRTPLTVILGMTRQIRIEPKKHLDTGTRLIESNGKNLLRLINQLLDLSKLEDNSFQLKLKQGDIVPYLRYITESFHTYANSKNLSLRFFTNLESLVMDYDEDQIQQILTNLISNALKFTPADGDILVRLTADDQQLNIEVRDNGIGIAEKDVPHIFDRFYQADSSHTREGEGTGIGLAHTLELVKIMGGDISVTSELGKGTSFLITLPISREAPLKDSMIKTERTALPTALETKEQDTTVLSTPPPNEELPQLLIIEDNQDVVIYLKSCLEGQYDLQVAYNGEIGIEKAFEYIPDLIISDVMMPGKDGFEVCNILKNDERTSHIPIILLTAKADAPSRIVGLRRGADAYLTKPFDKEELLVRLEMLVERQQRMVAHFSAELSGISDVNNNENEETIQVESAFLRKVQKIVAENYGDEDFSLPQLCQKIGMSRSQLFRKMQALIDTSPSAYIRDYRLNRAKELLETTDLNVSEIAWQVGFKNVAHFSKTFQDAFGHPPSATSK